MKNNKNVCSKYRLNCRLFLVCTLFVLSTLCDRLNAQEFKTVHEGVEYIELTREISGQQVKMNLLRLDLKKVRLDVAHAGTTVIGTAKTSVIAGSRGAVAAINAGFFRLDQSAFAGDPAGILQIDGKLLSESSNGRIALEITNDPSFCQSCSIPKNQTVVAFDHLNTFAEFWAGPDRFNISGIDREIKDNDAVLYTPEFGGATPKTELKTIEIVIEAKRIKGVLTTNGGTPIPRDGFVLAATGTKNTQAASIAIAGKEALTIVGSDSVREPNPGSNAHMKFIDVEDIVGGVPQLIRDGKIDITWDAEKTTKSFVETRHPRTAVAKLKDGKFLMITVDGRSESSGGIGLYDLAQLLLEFGATDAMNLDGGGSTTMFLDGKVVNHPSDKEGERAVSDALLVSLRKNSTTKKK